MRCRGALLAKRCTARRAGDLVRGCAQCALRAASSLSLLVLCAAAQVRAEGTAICAWDFRDAAIDTIFDSVQGLAANLKSGVDDVYNVMPRRTALGVELSIGGVNTGGDPIGNYIDLEGLSTVTWGGPTSVETVVTLRGDPSDHLLYDARFFACFAPPPAEQNAVFLDLKPTVWTPDLTITTAMFEIHHPTEAMYIPQHDVTQTIPRSLVSDVRYHIVATISGATMRIYINGVLEASGKGFEPRAVSRLVCSIGKSQWPRDGYLNATVEFLALYSGALTPGAIFSTCVAKGICASVPVTLWESFEAAMCFDRHKVTYTAPCFIASVTFALIWCALVAALLCYELGCLPLFALRERYVRRKSYCAALRHVCFYQCPCCRSNVAPLVDSAGRRFPWEQWSHARAANDALVSTAACFLSAEDLHFRETLLRVYDYDVASSSDLTVMPLTTINE